MTPMALYAVPRDEPTLCRNCGCPVDEHEQPSNGAPCAACFMLRLIDPSHVRCKGLATVTTTLTTEEDTDGDGLNI